MNWEWFRRTVHIHVVILPEGRNVSIQIERGQEKGHHTHTHTSYVDKCISNKPINIQSYQKGTYCVDHLFASIWITYTLYIHKYVNISKTT